MIFTIFVNNSILIEIQSNNYIFIWMNPIIQSQLNNFHKWLIDIESITVCNSNLNKIVIICSENWNIIKPIIIRLTQW